MDEVITRIVAIEKQCSAAIDQAQAESARRIEAHRHACETKKEEEQKQMLASENARKLQALNDTKKLLQTETADFMAQSERLFADLQLQARIKEEIINILLEA